MKKGLFIISVLLVFVLSSCTDDVILDCNAYGDNDFVNYNDECTAFKNSGYLSYALIYEVNLYDHDLNSENIDWMEVIYQYPLFYNDLLSYSENNLITFDSSDVNFVHYETGVLSIIYNDGENQEISKTIYVDIIDVTLIDNGTEENTEAAIGSFDIEYSGVDIGFITLDDGYYQVSFKDLNSDKSYLEYIYRGSGYGHRDIEVNIVTSYLGYKVEVITGETTKYYQVFHIDYVSNESVVFLNLPETHDSYLQIPLDSDLEYCVDYLELSREDNILRGKFVIYSGESILYEDEFELEWDNSDTLYYEEFNEYSIEMLRYAQEKFVIVVYPNMNDEFKLFTIKPEIID